eukprot:GHVN01028547.1.p1 GENE.GHVN01028547.1~~GHVN01028547.1.p1  ORF type:complete len:319 (+),score=102.03 GHVN01028547.1:55-1011(+)
MFFRIFFSTSLTSRSLSHVFCCSLRFCVLFLCFAMMIGLPVQLRADIDTTPIVATKGILDAYDRYWQASRRPQHDPWAAYQSPQTHQIHQPHSQHNSGPSYSSHSHIPSSRDANPFHQPSLSTHYTVSSPYHTSTDNLRQNSYLSVSSQQSHHTPHSSQHSTDTFQPHASSHSPRPPAVDIQDEKVDLFSMLSERPSLNDGSDTGTDTSGVSLTINEMYGHELQMLKNLRSPVTLLSADGQVVAQVIPASLQTTTSTTPHPPPQNHLSDTNEQHNSLSGQSHSSSPPTTSPDEGLSLLGTNKKRGRGKKKKGKWGSLF